MDFSNFFFEVGTRSSLLLLLFHLISFLLGFLTAWLIFRGKIRRLTELNENLEAQLASLTKDHNTLKATHDTTLGELSDANAEIERLRAKVQGLEVEKGNLHGDLFSLRKDHDTLKTNFADLEANGSANASVDNSAEVAKLKADLAACKSARKDLEEKLAEAKKSASAAVAAPAKKLSAEDKKLKSDAAKERVTSSLGTRIPKATAADADDLKLISGVGPFIEKKMNALGIFTFEQISKFDKDFIDTVTDAIEFFPGRIERDDWVSQAHKLWQDKLK